MLINPWVSLVVILGIIGGGLAMILRDLYRTPPGPPNPLVLSNPFKGTARLAVYRLLKSLPLKDPERRKIFLLSTRLSSRLPPATLTPEDLAVVHRAIAAHKSWLLDTLADRGDYRSAETLVYYQESLVPIREFELHYRKFPA